MLFIETRFIAVIAFYCFLLVSNLLWFIFFLYCVVLPLIYCDLLFTIVTYCPLFIVIYLHIPLWFIGFILLLCIVWYCTLFFLCYCGLSTHKLLWFIGICYCGLLWQLFLWPCVWLFDHNLPKTLHKKRTWVVSTISCFCCFLLFN